MRALIWPCLWLTACAAPLPPRAPLTLPPLPQERHGHRAELLPDGRILVFGGFDHADATAERGGRASWIFDPAQGAWSRTGDLHTVMAFHASAAADGAIYAVSGALERFDAARDAWELLIPGAELPTTHGAATALGRSLVAAGGFRNAIVDLDALNWETFPDYPDRHGQDHFSFLAGLEGSVHVAGGYGGADFQPLARHWAWDGRTWRACAPMPRPDAAKFAAWAADPADGRLYVIGADCQAVYDARRDSWTELPAPPWREYRAMPACVLREGYLYVLGGMGPEGRAYGVDVFDTVAGVWLP